MQVPYIKKLKKICGCNVFWVDGQYVRNKIDIEFTNFGQHYRFKFIPKNELWIDQEHAPSEEKYFIEHMLIERRLMSKGKTYADALVVADRHEQQERIKSKLIKKVVGKKNQTKKDVPGEIYERCLEKYSTHYLKVMLVSGELVRGLFYIDFTQGGHGFVYDFIPTNEVWLDNDLKPIERKFVLLHELHERRLMAGGMSYNRAHALASRLEYWVRRWPLFVNVLINLELKLNRRACFEEEKRKI